MFLFLPIPCGAIFKLVRSAFESLDDLPRSSEWIGQFVDKPFGCTRSNGTVGKDNVTNGVCARIWMKGIDEFVMGSVVFLDEKLGNLTKGRKACGEVL